MLSMLLRHNKKEGSGIVWSQENICMSRKIKPERKMACMEPIHYDATFIIKWDQIQFLFQGIWFVIIVLLLLLLFYRKIILSSAK